MAEHPRTERLGTTKVEHFFSSHGWLFREQFLHDYGIDAQVEIVEGNRPTGDLIGIQIKSGASYFSESNINSVVFRADEAHVDYWFQHSLPIIVVLHDPSQDECLWQAITEQTIENTGRGWKIEIPKAKKLDEGSLGELRGLTQPSEYFKKLNKLRLDKKWIKLLAEEEPVFIEYEDWINKSLPRFEIRIGCNSRDDVESERWPVLYGPGLSMEEAIEYTLPWANYEMDYDAHYDSMGAAWFDECRMGYDEDTHEPRFSMPYSEWYERPNGIVPISSGGETESYRLLLSLNKIGQAFYDLDAYLSEKDGIGRDVFTLDL